MHSISDTKKVQTNGNVRVLCALLPSDVVFLNGFVTLEEKENGYTLVLFYALL